jgi:hypothetical protein
MRDIKEVIKNPEMNIKKGYGWGEIFHSWD